MRACEHVDGIDLQELCVPEHLVHLSSSTRALGARRAEALRAERDASGLCPSDRIHPQNQELSTMTVEERVQLFDGRSAIVAYEYAVHAKGVGGIDVSLKIINEYGLIRCRVVELRER